jgi:hypothetical protein
LLRHGSIVHIFSIININTENLLFSDLFQRWIRLLVVVYLIAFSRINPTSSRMPNLYYQQKGKFMMQLSDIKINLLGVSVECLVNFMVAVSGMGLAV